MHYHKKLWQYLQDVLFPRFCLGCKKEGEVLCSICIKKIPIPGIFLCPNCCMDSENGIMCGKKCAKTMVLRQVISCVPYNENTLSGKVIRDMKYDYITEYNTIIAQHIAQFFVRFPGVLPEISMVVPVPLHKKRYIARGFNQAEYIAQSVSAVCNKPCGNVLTRTAHTKQQAHLTRQKRKTNMQNAFSLNIHTKGSVFGKHILLIDDVYTTGSTMNECARVLKEAGASNIVGFTYARG